MQSASANTLRLGVTEGTRTPDLQGHNVGAVAYRTKPPTSATSRARPSHPPTPPRPAASPARSSGCKSTSATTTTTTSSTPRSASASRWPSNSRSLGRGSSSRSWALLLAKPSLGLVRVTAPQLARAMRSPSYGTGIPITAEDGASGAARRPGAGCAGAAWGDLRRTVPTRREHRAEGVGFEPTVAGATHALQACRLVRSRIPP